MPGYSNGQASDGVQDANHSSRLIKISFLWPESRNDLGQKNPPLGREKYAGLKKAGFLRKNRRDRESRNTFQTQAAPNAKASGAENFCSRQKAGPGRITWRQLKWFGSSPVALSIYSKSRPTRWPCRRNQCRPLCRHEKPPEPGPAPWNLLP